MNCQEAFELLYDYIDKESSEIDTKKVQQHLDKCHHCFERFRLEESVQTLIDEKVKSVEPSMKLDSLKSNILNKLDEIDKEPSTKTTKLPFLRTSRLITIAATFVVFVGASFLIADFYRHSDHFIPLEKAHWQSSEQPTSFANSTVTSQSISTVYDSYDYNLSEIVSNFKLTGGRMEQLMGNDMAHFLYQNGDASVSVFVADAGSFKIPDELDEHSVQIGDTQFFDHNCRGCRLVFHRVGNAVIVTASTDREVDLLSFVPEAGSI